MKYSELIEFEKAISVIKLEDDDIDKEKKKYNVKTYVFSDSIIESLNDNVVPNLNPDDYDHEKKGVSVMGNYGTGKTHLLSVIASVAEDESFLEYITNERAKAALKTFAGRYRVLRFQIGTNKFALSEVVFSRIEKYLNNNGVDFHFETRPEYTYKDCLKLMMGAFEKQYPNKHFLLVIDEMLEYLKARDPNQLNADLMTLRQLGEMCDGTRFKVIYSVQEMLYGNSDFHHVSDALRKVEDRFANLSIEKEDVAFVVENRLLKKNSIQKQRIREHLQKFSRLFEGISVNLEKYVDLFPVHPRYIAKFTQIKCGKDKREILKTLGQYFEGLMDKEVPEDELGLITYDSYWDDLCKEPGVRSISDFRTINEKLEIILEKIETHFNIKGLKDKMPLAQRITKALAINILCDDIYKKLGANATTLTDDLCPILMGIEDRQLLLDTVEATASAIVNATQGQYVAKDDKSEDFYIRAEGGINTEQIVKEYANYIRKDSGRADQEFFDLLKIILGIERDPYRQGFKIFTHEIEWKSTKTFRLGYIFMGNSDDRSTTQPVQQFYIYFCPLFSEKRYSPENEQINEVYFDFSEFSEDFKDEVCLYIASSIKYNEASGNTKKLFEELVERHKKNATTLFEKCFRQKTQVIYEPFDSLPKSITNYPLLGEGAPILKVFSDVAAQILDECFNNKFPKYPKFNNLSTHIMAGNLLTYAQKALKKIIDYNNKNGDGQAILEGLALIKDNTVDVTGSPYAAYIINKLKESGGKVLNRAEVLKELGQGQELYYSVDCDLEYQLEFVVLAALVFSGEIEITWNNSLTLAATNIAEKVLDLSESDYFSFNLIKSSKEFPVKAIQKLFQSLGLPNLVSRLKEPSTFTKLFEKITQYSDNVARALNIAKSGIFCTNIALLSDEEKSEKAEKLQNLLSALDEAKRFDTFAKFKNFKLTEADLENAFSAYPSCEALNALKATAATFEGLIQYLNQAKSYIDSDNPLEGKITQAVLLLPAQILKDEGERKSYEDSLKRLKEEYAAYYLKEYTKTRLNYNDGVKKDELLECEKARTCDLLKDVSVINKREYEVWREELATLKKADPDVTAKAILQDPYKDFNPREEKTHRAMSEIEETLDKLFDKWLKVLKEIFDDPIAKQNITLLSEEQKAVVEQFLQSGGVRSENAATLRDAINAVVVGFEKVELSANEISLLFSKPLGAEEAKKAFEEMLDRQCAGKEYEKVRIIYRQ